MRVGVLRKAMLLLLFTKMRSVSPLSKLLSLRNAPAVIWESSPPDTLRTARTLELFGTGPAPVAGQKSTHWKPSLTSSTASLGGLTVEFHVPPYLSVARASVEILAP